MKNNLKIWLQRICIHST